MKYLKQFGIILFISFVGEILNYLIPLPIPASIYGIIILFLALELKILKLEAVRDVGMFLVEIMPVMFIPAAAELLNAWEILRPSILAYMVITVVTTVIVMAASGLMTQLVIRIRKKKEDKKNG